MDPNSETSSRTTIEVRTSGELLGDGTLLDLVRLSPAEGEVGSIHWDGKAATVGLQIEHSGKIYRLVEVPASVLRAVTFPARFIDYGSAADLVDRIVAFLDRYTGVIARDLPLVAFFVLATWFPEFVFQPLTLFISSQFPAEAPSLLRALRSLCRRSLLVGELNPTAFCRLPLSLRPTVIMDQTSLSRSLAGVLRVSNAGSLLIGKSGDFVEGSCFQVLFSCVNHLEPRQAQHMLHVSLAPRRADVGMLDGRGMQEASAELQPRLLAYRLKNFAQVSASRFDATEFPGPVRELARTLGAVVVDDALLQKLVASLRPVADDVRAQNLDTPEFAIAVSVLDLLHSRERKVVPVNVLAVSVNAVLKSFGEIVEFSAPEIGYRLASLGLYTTRTASAKVLRLDRGTSRIAHDIGWRLGVRFPSGGFPDCPDCGIGSQATENNQVL